MVQSAAHCTSVEEQPAEILKTQDKTQAANTDFLWQLLGERSDETDVGFLTQRRVHGHAVGMES